MILIKAVLLSLSQAFGCSCAPQDIKTEFARSDYVLVATVLEKVGRDFDAYDDLSQVTDFEVALKITKSYKGHLKRNPYITTPSDEARCGVSLKVGETYLFWMDRPHPDSGTTVPAVYLCSRTKPISQAKSDIKWLEKKAGRSLITSFFF
jgi:hypothetical protein